MYHYQEGERSASVYLEWPTSSPMLGCDLHDSDRELWLLMSFVASPKLHTTTVASSHELAMLTVQPKSDNREALLHLTWL